MKRVSLCAISAILLTWATIAAADSASNRNKKLKGDYAVTGSSTCLIALDGFNANQQANSNRVFTQWSSVLAIRTYNGDGTGSVQGSSVTVTAPVPSPTFNFPPNAASGTFSFSFTYSVQPDGTFTTALVPGTWVGTSLTGTRAGQTNVIDKLSFTGLIALDGKVLEVATVVPELETLTWSNGDVWPEYCTRSRVHTRIENGDRDRDHDDDRDRH